MMLLQAWRGYLERRRQSERRYMALLIIGHAMKGCIRRRRAEKAARPSASPAPAPASAGLLQEVSRWASQIFTPRGGESGAADPSDAATSRAEVDGGGSWRRATGLGFFLTSSDPMGAPAEAPAAPPAAAPTGAPPLPVVALPPAAAMREDEAALVVQAAARGRFAREAQRRARGAATAVQARCRGMLGRREVRQERRQEQQRQHDGAATVQAHTRGWRARKRRANAGAPPPPAAAGAGPPAGPPPAGPPASPPPSSPSTLDWARQGCRSTRSSGEGRSSSAGAAAEDIELSRREAFARAGPRAEAALLEATGERDAGLTGGLLDAPDSQR